jgi:hypothetical protein
MAIRSRSRKSSMTKSSPVTMTRTLLPKGTRRLRRRLPEADRLDCGRLHSVLGER